MVIRTRFRRILTYALFYSVVLGASGFFALHAYTGERGLIARREHKVRIAQLTRQLDELQFERTAIERRVTELSNERLDKDLLDERVRAVLNLSHRNDVIIQTNK